MPQSPWFTWTPTWTNLTVGNGTVEAIYQWVGGFVFCRLSLVFGSTTSVSGSVSFSLPVKRAVNAGAAGLTPQGNAGFFDTSATSTFEGGVTNLTTTTSVLVAKDVSSTYSKVVVISSTIPFTWATGDELAAQFFYQAESGS